MDRIDAMRVFTRVMDRRSFTLAAQDLGIPRSTATDAVKRIETRLGVRLLDRTTRHVAPTLDGEAYYQRCRRILADIEDAEGALTGTRPNGVLRVEVHGTLARHVVLPELPAFLDAYPGIDIRMSEGDALIDPVREGVDCVLRVGEPRDGGMIARRIALLPEATLAAPAYLARHGRPGTPDDLAGNHRMVGFRTQAGSLLPLLFSVRGAPCAVTLPARLSVDAAESYLDAAKAGLGLIQIPRYHADALIRSGVLATVLDDYAPPPTPVSLLYPRDRAFSPRLRVFIGWITALFRQGGY